MDIWSGRNPPYLAFMLAMWELRREDQPDLGFNKDLQSEGWMSGQGPEWEQGLTAAAGSRWRWLVLIEAWWGTGRE
jgi:hypothetical protein